MGAFITIVVYIFIGGFLCGLIPNDLDPMSIGMFVMLWPLAVVIALLAALVYFPYKLGQLAIETIADKLGW